MLALTMIPGLGPVLIARAVRALGGAQRVLEAGPGQLATVEGIGPERARAFFEHKPRAMDLAHAELARAAALGAAIVTIDDPAYPPLLREVPSAPPLLYVRGQLNCESDDRFCVALVGSRACTPYGLEQSARFASFLAASGLTVVSGGARGIDTSAHQAALRAGGRTIVVLGCGVGRAYPPENRQLFDRIVSEGRGAIISELPVSTEPEAKNFPARNRLISGLSLGVVLVEAARGSGSLITARQAVEEHGREVFAVPGRVDSPASEGTNDLIKQGGAMLVTNPADVLAALESAARHQHAGTHASRFAPSQADLFTPQTQPQTQPQPQPQTAPLAPTPEPLGLSPDQVKIFTALHAAGTALPIDRLVASTGLSAQRVAAELTMLELRRAVVRRAGAFEPAKPI
jgi:DNA processing protein